MLILLSMLGIGPSLVTAPVRTAQIAPRFWPLPDSIRRRCRWDLGLEKSGQRSRVIVRTNNNVGVSDEHTQMETARGRRARGRGAFLGIAHRRVRARTPHGRTGHDAVGWVNEPTYVGFMNAVQLFLSDKNKKPISGAGDTLKVQVTFGDQKTALLPSSTNRTNGPASISPRSSRTVRGTTRSTSSALSAGRRSISRSRSSETTFDPVGDSDADPVPGQGSRRSPTSRGSWTG